MKRLIIGLDDKVVMLDFAPDESPVFESLSFREMAKLILKPAMQQLLFADAPQTAETLAAMEHFKS